jgi:hypothetical protein
MGRQRRSTDRSLIEQVPLPGFPEPQEAVSSSVPTGPRRFRPYTQNQLFLPMDCDDMIPLNPVARVVNDAVDRLDDALFVDVYPGGGRPPYHPVLGSILVTFGSARTDFRKWNVPTEN